MTISGKLSQEGASVTLDLGFRPGHGCAGTVEEMGGTITLVVIGTTVYYKADDAFWKANEGADAPSIIGILHGRYIKTSTSAQGMDAFAQLCDLSQQIGSETVGRNDVVTRGAPVTLHGTRVLPLTNHADELYVTDTGKPEIVEIVDNNKADLYGTASYASSFTSAAMPTQMMTSRSPHGGSRRPIRAPS